MGELRCKRIAVALSEALARLGWDGFVYSFTLGVEWTEPGATYVREASELMFEFLRDYRSQHIQRSHHRLAIVRSDLPQTFEVASFCAAPLDRKLAHLMSDYGWRSGMAFPQYGYGGALGLTTFVARAPRVAPDIADQTIIYMSRRQMQLNAWARELVERGNLARSLSAREAECLLLVAEGKTSREIAATLGIAKRTVEFHIQNAMHKLGGSSRSQAASMLVQLALPQLNHASTPWS
jgi:DNA-binding CsgD family transcriptional regulator